MKKKMILFLVIFFCAILLFPIVFTIVGSFKGHVEMSQYLSPLIKTDAGYISADIVPLYPTLQSYIEVLIDTPEYMILFWNTMLNTVLILVGQILISVPAAWGITRMSKRRQSIVILIYTILMILPFVVTMLPQYIVLNRLNLLNTRWSIVLPSIFSPFSVFILYYHLKGIPNILVEQAIIDGADNWIILKNIVIPIGKPGIIAAGFLGFIEEWNMIEQPIIFIKDQQFWPVTLFAANITSDNIGIIFTASVITLIPAICAFYIGCEYLEQGFSEVVDKE